MSGALALFPSQSSRKSPKAPFSHTLLRRPFSAIRSGLQPKFAGEPPLGHGQRR